jgi:hypothetical protein
MRAVPGARRDPVGAGGRRRRHGAHGAGRGFDRLIGFDMGGTSTDVCHYAGTYERSFETEVAGVRMRAPMMHIHTVAAGGGSILSSGRPLQVGPESAGADPGPGLLPQGRAADRHRLQRHAGQTAPRPFSRRLRAERGQPLDADVVRRDGSRRWPRRSAMAAARMRSPKVSCGSPSRTWPTRSRRSRSSAAMT